MGISLYTETCLHAIENVRVSYAYKTEQYKVARNVLDDRIYSFTQLRILLFQIRKSSLLYINQYAILSLVELFYTFPNALIALTSAIGWAPLKLCKIGERNRILNS